MNINCTWRFTIVADDVAEVPAEVDRIMQHLLELEDGQLHDAAIGLDLATMSVEISIAVHAESPDQGIVTAMSAIRAAVHAAGGSTPDWPMADEALRDGWQLRHGQLTAA